MHNLKSCGGGGGGGGGEIGGGGGGGVLPLLLSALLLFVGACGGTPQIPSSPVPRCHHTHHYGILAADCHNVLLREVPQNLRSDVKAIDLTLNRIREIPVGVFDRYTSLELLYMDDNAIDLLEEGALEPLRRLRVLSLSLNSLKTVPETLLRLPSLKRLDLARNRLSYESLATALATARTDGPLEVLSLADCQLRALPPLQRLPRLRELNVSGNPLAELRARQLAPLCSLRLVVLGDAHATIDFCDCLMLREWSQHYDLQLHPPQALECEGRAGATEPSRCASGPAAQEAAGLRAECSRALEVQERERRRRRLWAWAGGGAGGLLALLALLALCCWCCRRRRGGRQGPAGNGSRRGSVAYDARPLAGGGNNLYDIKNNLDDDDDFHKPMKT